jgi:glycyl-tRNA synthetase (class II)
MKDQTVTLRDRDLMTQVRIPIARIEEEIRGRIEAPNRETGNG